MINDALTEFEATMVKIGGCTDGGCVIVRPKGMHTNGGCKCYKNEIKMQHYIQAVNRLKKSLVEGQDGK